MNYIKQVAQAVRDACEDEIGPIDVDLDTVIARVPKPEPVAWGNIAPKFRESDRVIFTDKVVAEDYNENCYPLAPLYAHAPDEQAEINRLNKLIEEKDRDIRVIPEDSPAPSVPDIKTLAKGTTMLSNPTLAELITAGCTLLDTNEAASSIRFQPQTLRKWACYDNGPIRPVRIAGRLRWRVSDLFSLVKGGEK